MKRVLTRTSEKRRVGLHYGESADGDGWLALFAETKAARVGEAGR